MKYSKYIVSIVFVGLLAGCTIKDGKLRGLVTGKEYTKQDIHIIYKYVKNGVISYYTEKEIEKMKLDKADGVVTKVYNVYDKHTENTVK